MDLQTIGAAGYVGGYAGNYNDLFSGLNLLVGPGILFGKDYHFIE